MTNPRIGMPDDDHPEGLTDAQWAAREAARALSLGRYTLGSAFANIARQAARQHPNHAEARNAMFGDHSVRNVPLVGHTRAELPRVDQSHAPAECLARVELQGFETQCGQPIRWATTEPGGWYHVDPEITDHEAQAHAY